VWQRLVSDHVIVDDDAQVTCGMHGVSLHVLAVVLTVLSASWRMPHPCCFVSIAAVGPRLGPVGLRFVVVVAAAAAAVILLQPFGVEAPRDLAP
jgi:hypothetical protein